jgi:hypothetical protein
MKTNLEIITIEHKEVKVTIKIDYDQGTLSLVENLHERYADKKWFFAGRGLAHMNGWQNILEAMQMAVAEGKKRLESDLAEKSRFREDTIEYMHLRALDDRRKAQAELGEAKKQHSRAVE